MTPEAPTIGFIGLGVMGLPMAQNLLIAGYPLVVHSRTASRCDPLVEQGATPASSPAKVAAQADIVITMLPNSPDVVAVADGPDGILGAAHDGLTWIDMSSIAPTVAQEVAARATAAGIEFLDAPVSGGEKGAIDGTLSIMVGGTQAGFDRCRPLFEHLGSSAVLVGEAGAGQVAKVCNQVVVGCTIACVAEALVLAAKAGLDAGKVREVLLGGFAGSKILDVHGERMLTRNFAPGFRTRLHEKDMANALDTARSFKSPLPVAAVVTELMSALDAMGHDDLDHSALVMVYEHLANQQLG